MVSPLWMHFVLIVMLLSMSHAQSPPLMQPFEVFAFVFDASGVFERYCWSWQPHQSASTVRMLALM